MSEMALTADHLIVVGRGRLIADTSVAEFVATSVTGWVLVRSPHHQQLAPLLREAGATVHPDGDTSLAVTGMSTDQIGELAARHGLTLHELTAREASLEEAFMQSTRDAVVFQPQAADPEKAA